MTNKTNKLPSFIEREREELPTTETKHLGEFNFTTWEMGLSFGDDGHNYHKNKSCDFDGKIWC